jgi:hypothetical protein
MECRRSYARILGLLLWHGIRLPVLMLLIIVEPVVSFLLGGLALLGVLTTIFFWSLKVPQFPAFTMLMLSLGFGLASVLYQIAIRVLSD